MLRLQFYINQA